MVPDYAKNILHNNKELQIDNGFISLNIRKGDVFNLEVITL